ncbi:transposase [Patescibacteria group bacterium]|nr:transposase [Patescibacteria group bacterium]MBU1921924.1 transposase [Patescibacteria group bacterium]
MPTLRIAKINENEPHFLTLTVIEWINIFTKAEYFKAIAESLEFCRKNKGLSLYEYVIMTNHLHIIGAAKEPEVLSNIIRDFKRNTTKEILKLLERDNRKYILRLIKHSFQGKKGNEMQVWQRENYPQVIVSEEFYLKQVNYIHNNPVKAGYVEKPEDWLYSSARNHILTDSSIIKLNDSFY